MPENAPLPDFAQEQVHKRSGVFSRTVRAAVPTSVKPANNGRTAAIVIAIVVALWLAPAICSGIGTMVFESFAGSDGYSTPYP